MSLVILLSITRGVLCGYMHAVRSSACVCLHSESFTTEGGFCQPHGELGIVFLLRKVPVRTLPLVYVVAPMSRGP